MSLKWKFLAIHQILFVKMVILNIPINSDTKLMIRELKFKFFLEKDYFIIHLLNYLKIFTVFIKSGAKRLIYSTLIINYL
jgi:hypothetical protein